MRGGVLIREARRRAGISQAELARRLGTSQSAVARWESRRQEPAFATVVRAVRACGFDLGVSISTADDQDELWFSALRARTTDERLAYLDSLLAAERWAQTAKRVG